MKVAVTEVAEDTQRITFVLAVVVVPLVVVVGVLDIMILPLLAVVAVVNGVDESQPFVAGRGAFTKFSQFNLLTNFIFSFIICM